MKSPVWILNSVLALFLLIMLLYISFSSWEIPSQPSLVTQPISTVPEERKPLEQRFLQTIYEDNDLFGTYIAQPIEQLQSLQISPPPRPPAPRPIIPLAPVAVNFLEPLNITITGIIIGSSESSNQVIISDSAKQEKIYKTGDKILDAHILRIFRNKIMLIRSNGQQETLYINATEAQAEMKLLQESSWANVVEQKAENNYLVDPESFASRVTNLADFIEMLDITTVFDKGKSIGCRIGKMNDKSIGQWLGFKQGDIITLINTIEPTTTKNRVDIYNSIRSAQEGSVITVNLLRNSNTIELRYTLQPLQEKNPLNTQKASSMQVSVHQPTDIKLDKAQLLQEKHKFNSLLENVTTQDRQAMAHYGGRTSVLREPKRS